MIHRARAAVLSLPLLVLAASPLAAQPSGLYQARPGPVLLCSDSFPACSEIFQLEGGVGFELLSAPFPGGGDPDARFTGSDLFLRSASLLHSNQDQPFPPPGGPGLADLVGEPRPIGDGWIFVEPPGAPQDIELEVVSNSNGALLVRGTWDDRCCSGFLYELGGPIFDYAGPGGVPVLFLSENRFAITVAWQDHQGGSGFGTPVTFDPRSGRFWFFNPHNPELLVKVIDGCEHFGVWWFFAAGLTDVGVEITVEDQRLGSDRVYTRPRGVPFAPILDTVGFPCIP